MGDLVKKKKKNSPDEFFVTFLAFTFGYSILSLFLKTNS
jgi:hypothetical protein